MSQILPSSISLLKSPQVPPLVTFDDLTNRRDRVLKLLAETDSLATSILTIGIKSVLENKKSSRLRDALTAERERLVAFVSKLQTYMDVFIKSIRSFGKLKSTNAKLVPSGIDKESMLKVIATEWALHEEKVEDTETSELIPENKGDDNSQDFSKTLESLQLSAVLDDFQKVLGNTQSALKKSAFVLPVVKSTSNIPFSEQLESNHNLTSVVNRKANDLSSKEELLVESQVANSDQFLQLERQVSELVALFTDVNEIVQVQGAEITTLEQHVLQTKEYTASAVSNLQDAYFYKHGQFAFVGTAVGALVGGPVGAVIGMKTAVASAGIVAGVSAMVGGISGYIAGKYISTKLDDRVNEVIETHGDSGKDESKEK